MNIILGIKFQCDTEWRIFRITQCHLFRGPVILPYISKWIKRQRSGTDTIEFHILPQIPNGKGIPTVKMAPK